MAGFDAEAEGQAVYRPVSTLAVLALVAGGLSAVALSTPVLWIVPLLAAGLAGAAVRDTAGSAPAKAGRGLALAGLGLALGFGCQAVGFAATDYWIGRTRAVETACSWQQAVSAGRWAEAHSFCAPAALPVAGDPAAAGPVPHDHAGAHSHDEDGHPDDSPALQVFRQLPAVATVSGCREAAVAGCRRDDAFATGSWRVTLALGGCDGAVVTGRPRQVELVLLPEIVRVPLLTPEGTGTQRVERWRIIRFDPEDS